MIKVMIADDQALIRESLQIILSAHQDIQVTSAVADGHEVLERIPQDRPDVVLMDIRMPKMDGVMATKEVKERFPEVKIIILTTFDDDDFIFRALKYGASGYLLKGASTEELYQAIQIVYHGGAMINPTSKQKKQEDPKTQSGVSHLTFFLHRPSLSVPKSLVVTPF